MSLALRKATGMANQIHRNVESLLALLLLQFLKWLSPPLWCHPPWKQASQSNPASTGWLVHFFYPPSLF